MPQTFIFTFFFLVAVVNVFPGVARLFLTYSPGKVTKSHLALLKVSIISTHFTAASGPYPSILFYMFHHILKSTVQTCRRGILTVRTDTVYPQFLKAPKRETQLSCTHQLCGSGTQVSSLLSNSVSLSVKRKD